MRLLIGTLALLLVAACSSPGSDDGNDDGDVSGPSLNRSSADQALAELAEAALDGKSPANGVVLEDSCPVLGDQSVADVLAESGVDLDVDGGRPAGFLSAVSDGFNLNCSVHVGDRHAALNLSQTAALDAGEFLRLTPPNDEISVDTDVDAAGFAEDSLAVVGSPDREMLAWFGDGFSLQVALHDDGPLSRDDQVAFLTATLDAVIETLDAATDNEEPEMPEPVVERDAAIDAFTDAVEDFGPRQVRLDAEEGCPFLDEAALSDLVGDAGWPIEPVFNGGMALAGRRTLMCTVGDAPQVRSLEVAFDRALTVPGLAAQVEGPAHSSPPMTITALKTSNSELEGRAYLRELEPDDAGPTSTSVGWIDNGLRIEASLREGDDPEQVLAAVLPAALAGLDLT